MKNNTLIHPGIRKNMSIEKMFINITIAIIGPSKASIKVNGKVLSRIPRSFENLFVSCPIGIMSKKEQGLLTNP